MARTSKPKRSHKAAPRPSLQAPPGTWSPAELSAALRRGTIEEKVALLSTIGILDAKGELAKTYRSWGNKVTRTPDFVDEPA